MWIIMDSQLQVKWYQILEGWQYKTFTEKLGTTIALLFHLVSSPQARKKELWIPTGGTYVKNPLLFAHDRAPWRECSETRMLHKYQYGIRFWDLMFFSGILFHSFKNTEKKENTSTNLFLNIPNMAYKILHDLFVHLSILFSNHFPFCTKYTTPIPLVIRGVSSIFSLPSRRFSPLSTSHILMSINFRYYL